MNNLEVIRSCMPVSEQDLRDQMELSNDEINLILGYVEGHGCKLYWGNQERWVLVDTEEPDNEPEELYDIGELIERVNQWNYEFLLEDTVAGAWREEAKMDADIIAKICEQLGERRGYYLGTPTVRELIAILSKLPQDYKVTCCGGENYIYRFETGKYVTIDHEYYL